MKNITITIFVFGGKDIKEDSLPVRILPKLKKEFPDIRFLHLDPNEELEGQKHLYIIDTVQGVKRVSIFRDPAIMKKRSGVTVHDFDLATMLILLKKLGKLPPLLIIGIPPHLKEETALRQVKAKIQSNVFSENERRSSYKDRMP